MGSNKHHSKWWVLALFYFLVESSISALFIAIGFWWEVELYGNLVPHKTQSLFAHLVLSYGCGLFLFGAFLSCCVQQARVGYIIVALCNFVLGGISVGYGIGVLLKPKLFFAHGYIRYWYDLYHFIAIIVGVAMIVHGVWNWMFSVFSFMKFIKVRKMRTAAAKKDKKNRSKSRSRSRTPSRVVDLDVDDDADNDFEPDMAVAV